MIYNFGKGIKERQKQHNEQLLIIENSYLCILPFLLHSVEDDMVLGMRLYSIIVCYSSNVAHWTMRPFVNVFFFLLLSFGLFVIVIH